MAADESGRWLEAERLRLMQRVVPAGIVTSMGLAVVAVALQWTHIELLPKLAWGAAVLTVSVWRLLVCRHYRRLESTEPGAVHGLCDWHRRGCLAAGIVWSLSLLLLWHPHDQVAQLLLVFVLAGVTSGAATSLSVDIAGLLYFELPILAALLLRLLAQGSAASVGMSVAVALYTFFILSSARRYSANTTENIGLRLQAARREVVLQESETRFRQLAQVDALTGLANRYAMQAQVPALLSAAAAANARVALLYIDLDNFKDINDTRGHGCGDALLKAVAQRLGGAVRPEDAVYRMGGDEFIVVTRHAQSRTQVESLAECLRDTLALPLDIDGREAGVGASIGIGVYPDDGLDVESLLKHADVALYQAKNHGRNEYRFYSAGQSQAIAERIELENALTRAIESEALFLEYQPLLSIESGAVVGLEALARWQHPERGLIPPVTFVAVAERCGLIDALGELLLRQLCRQLQEWQRELLTVLPVAINVSPRQFDHGRFVRSFEAITQQFGVDPSSIEVEVTESALMSRGDGHHEALEALQRHGVRIAIDDFGTGYSSLSYLKHLPVAGVKIDRSFVRDMLCDPRDAAIVTAVINIGHSLGLRVVAEGVETLSQLQRLQLLGCDVAQGYYHYRPLSAAQAGELIAAEARRPLPDRKARAAAGGRLRTASLPSAASPLRRLP